MRLPGTPVSSVYLHAPFCARRCFYCDFAVEVRRVGDLAEWSGAIEREVALRAEEGLVLADRLRTLYVGGGTPSLLGPDAMAAMGSVLGADRLSDPDLEWTAEANPESFTRAVAEGWRSAGVTRLSLGVQSFEEEVLGWMGRLHGAAGALAALDTARSAGFEEVSVDLIFGLPEGVKREWSADLDRVLKLGVPHISLYGLTAEQGTGLGRRVTQGELRMPDDERYRAEYLEAHHRLTDAGYRHYEVSNFALPGSESRHNRVYWSGDPWLGLGNGAHSFVPPLRWWNTREWAAYRDALLADRDPSDGREVSEGASDRLERIWMGLRTAEGLSLREWPNSVEGCIEEWVDRGVASRSGRRVRLNAEGWLLLDTLTLEFDRAAG
ncbi:MAG: radical SAM family heme chaperone HemW [Longimicrobiales bacterium]|nr:radical SAM family heme chaperone HemW [Longimicrobiales bacterium]